MKQAQKGNTVKVHYTGKFDDGTVFDTSAEREPLEFVIGGQQVIPGFEEAVVGMPVGAEKTVRIPSDEAYGARREDLVMEVERSKMPPDIDPVEGLMLNLQSPAGETVVVTVTSVDEEAVTLDANHPLAGKDLTFDIELIEVQG